VWAWPFIRGFVDCIADRLGRDAFGIGGGAFESCTLSIARVILAICDGNRESRFVGRGRIGIESSLDTSLVEAKDAFLALSNTSTLGNGGTFLLATVCDSVLDPRFGSGGGGIDE